MRKDLYLEFQIELEPLHQELLYLKSISIVLQNSFHYPIIDQQDILVLLNRKEIVEIDNELKARIKYYFISHGFHIHESGWGVYAKKSKQSWKSFKREVASFFIWLLPLINDSSQVELSHVFQIFDKQKRKRTNFFRKFINFIISLF